MAHDCVALVLMLRFRSPSVADTGQRGDASSAWFSSLLHDVQTQVLWCAVHEEQSPYDSDAGWAAIRNASRAIDCSRAVRLMRWTDEPLR